MAVLVTRPGEQGLDLCRALSLNGMQSYHFPLIEIQLEQRLEGLCEQMKTVKSAKFIIAPHGAALANIPFLPNNALIIECCHDEWHPYYYFPGLSHSCGNFHALVCNNPAVFPAWYSSEYNGQQKKLNIIADIDKIINIIDNYYNNNFKNKTCYLF